MKIQRSVIRYTLYLVIYLSHQPSLFSQSHFHIFGKSSVFLETVIHFKVVEEGSHKGLKSAQIELYEGSRKILTNFTDVNGEAVWLVYDIRDVPFEGNIKIIADNFNYWETSFRRIYDIEDYGNNVKILFPEFREDYLTSPSRKYINWQSGADIEPHKIIQMVFRNNYDVLDMNRYSAYPPCEGAIVKSPRLVKYDIVLSKLNSPYEMKLSVEPSKNIDNQSDYYYSYNPDAEVNQRKDNAANNGVIPTNGSYFEGENLQLDETTKMDDGFVEKKFYEYILFRGLLIILGLFLLMHISNRISRN